MKHKNIIANWLGHKTETTPIWLMRQAGRYLPEYRALRAKSGGFLNMVYNPDIATEITLQPLQRFDLDAAILFSDILVIPHALGLKLEFLEGEGPKLDTIQNASDFKKINETDFLRHLTPVLEAVSQIKSKIPENKALIGFAGAPFTVASYMVHGSGGHDFGIIKNWAKTAPKDFKKLIDILVRTTTEYLIAQIKAGAEAVQIFESWAGALTGEDFNRWVIAPNAEIINKIKMQYPDIPVIGFPRTSNQNDVERFVLNTKVNAVGLSQDISLDWASNTLQPKVCVQGNLAPELLLEGGENMIRTAKNICEKLSSGPFVFNLGHGVIKETNPDHVATLINTVHNFKRT